MWSEDVASRGGQEIASCIMKHLQTKISSETDHAILYSDSCGGQNRNIKVMLMLKKYLSTHPHLKTITQKFFISGHSYNSCDRSFGIIEKEKKNATDLYIPDQWIDLVKAAKKSEPKFDVTKMESKDFFSSSDLEKMIVNRKKDIGDHPIRWLDFRSIRYSKDYLFTFTASNSIQVNIKKKNVQEDEFKKYELVELFPNGRPINEKKYKDLIDLLKFVPGEHHKFYNNLVCDAEEDYGLASDASATSDTDDDD